MILEQQHIGPHEEQSQPDPVRSPPPCSFQKTHPVNIFLLKGGDREASDGASELVKASGIIGTIQPRRDIGSDHVGAANNQLDINLPQEGRDSPGR